MLSLIQIWIMGGDLSFIESADDSKLGRQTDRLEGSVIMYRDCDRLEDKTGQGPVEGQQSD